jgi:hypothetical protein
MPGYAVAAFLRPINASAWQGERRFRISTEPPKSFNSERGIPDYWLAINAETPYARAWRLQKYSSDALRPMYHKIQGLPPSDGDSALESDDRESVSTEVSAAIPVRCGVLDRK